MTVLRLGHVVPKWMYEWAKNEGGRRLHGTYPSLGIPHDVAQDGEKQYLLCAGCEAHMSEAERYMRSLMVGSAAERARIGVTESDGAVVGLDVDLVERFLLGTALRAHFATAGAYHCFALPEQDVLRVRQALLAGPATDARFPIFAVRIVSSRVRDADPRAFVFAFMHEFMGYPTFRLFAAGWEWFTFFGLGSGTLADDRFAGRLRPGAAFDVIVQELNEHPLIRGLVAFA